MRTVSAIVQLVTLGVGAAEQLDRMTEERLENGQSITNAARAPREIDDEGTAADPGNAAGQPCVRRSGGASGANRLGDARRLALEDRPRRLGRDVPRSETRSARRDDDVSDVAVGPGGESRADRRGIVGDHGAGGRHVTMRDRPLRNDIAAPVLARAPRDPVRYGENGQAYRVHARLLPR